MSSQRSRGRGARVSDRATAAIAALKSEFLRRIQALDALAAAEERWHADTIAWMSDVDESLENCSWQQQQQQEGRQEGDIERPGGQEAASSFTYETFSAIGDSLERAAGTDDEGPALYMQDLANSPDFESLVEVVTLYKRACFGNDSINVDAAGVRDMILKSPNNALILRPKTNAPLRAKDDERGEGRRPDDLEDDYEDEINRKLMLLPRFYGLESTKESQRPRQQPPRLASASTAPTELPAVSPLASARVDDANGARQQQPASLGAAAAGPSEADKDHCANQRSRPAANKVRRRADFNDMEQWMLAHILNPYPTQQEKATLAMKLGMEVTQVQHWFVAESLKKNVIVASSCFPSMNADCSRFSNIRKRKYIPVCENRRPPRDDFEIVLFEAYQDALRDAAALDDAETAAAARSSTGPA